MKCKVFDYNGIGIQVFYGSANVFIGAKELCEALEVGNPNNAIKRYLKPEDYIILKRKSYPELKCLPRRGKIAFRRGAAYYLIGIKKHKKPEFAEWAKQNIVPFIKELKKQTSTPETKKDDTDKKANPTVETPKVHQETSTVDLQAVEDIVYDVIISALSNAIKEIKKIRDKKNDEISIGGVRDVAKLLKVSERKMVNCLLANGILYRDKKGTLKPKSGYVPEYFLVEKFVNEQTKIGGVKTVITEKGIELIKQALKEKCGLLK